MEDVQYEICVEIARRIARRLTRPFRLWFRLLGLVVLMTYALALQSWATIQPLVQPVVRIYRSIDYDTVNLASGIEASIKATLMAAIFNWKIVQAAWDLVTRPFDDFICRLMEALRQLNDRLRTVALYSCLPETYHHLQTSRETVMS